MPTRPARLSRRHAGASCALALLICLLCRTSPVSAQGVTLQGFVTDHATGQPLQGATVALQPLPGMLVGTATTKDGFYRITQVAPGAYVFRVSYLGYRTYADTVAFGPDAVVVRSVALQPTEENLNEVVVSAQGGAARLEGGLQVVRPADIARIPTPDASGDLASYLQTLPGVVSIGDRGGQLYVRGGTPDQNLVLLDGMLVYQPFHIVGFFSTFTEDVVSNVDFYAGGFGARYTGRVSSVIDVSLREGNKQKFAGTASISPFLASVLAEGPLKKGKTSFLASVRSSVIEQVAPTLLGQPLPLRFGDEIVKLHGASGSSGFWSVTGLHTYDRGRIDPAQGSRSDVFRWNNLVVGGRLLSIPPNSRVLFDGNTAFSYIRNSIGSPDHPERSSDAFRLNMEGNLRTFAGRTDIDLGFFARMNWFGYHLAEQFTNLGQEDNMLLSAGGYVGAHLPVGNTLKVNPSIALVVYPFMFTPSIEPRLRVSWRPGGDHGTQGFNAAFGVYRQTVLGISDERDAGSVFVAWMPAPFGGSQTRAIHSLLGWQGDFGPFRLAAEGYYKRLTNVYVPIWSAIAQFTTQLTLAKGNVYGLDTRVEFQKHPVYAYVGYGLSNTEYEAKQDNFGVWFGTPVQRYHPPHDRRHQVNVLLSVDIGKVRANVRWQFGSGLPFTRPFGFDDLIRFRTLVDVRKTPGIPRILYAKPYQGRLPTYHRLDLSAERTFSLHGANLTLQAGAINLYDRANLFYYDIFTTRRVDQLPLLPYVSLKIETR